MNAAPDRPPSDPRRAEQVMGGIVRVLGGWDLLQVGAWTVFLAVFPPLCLLRGMHFGAVLCSALGLFLANMLFTESTRFATMPGRAALRWGMNLLLCAVGAWSLSLLLRPVEGWKRVPGTGDWSEVCVAQDRGELLAVHVADRALRLGRFRGNSWGFIPYPGLLTWSMLVAPDGVLWAAPQDDDELLSLAPGSSDWKRTALPEADFVRHLRVDGEGALLLVTSRQIFRMGPGGAWSPLGPARATDVCHAGPGSPWVLAGPQGVFEGKSPEKLEQALSWDVGFPQVACARSGRAYAADGGMLRGHLRVRAAGGGWSERALPAQDVRVLLADPAQGDEVWIGTWGEGIFRSIDGGERWEAMGLPGVEVRSMVVDFEARRVWAASANLVGRSGVWERSF